MTTMAVAIQRIRVWNWHAGRVVGVVIVADQVRAAFYLRRFWPEHGRICRLSAGRGGLRERSHGTGTAEVGVRVVDAGVDDGNLDFFTSIAGYALPHFRRADVRHADHILYFVLRHIHHLHHARHVCEVRDLAAGDLDLHAVQRIVIMGEHFAAKRD